MPKSEDSSSCIKEADNDEKKFASISVKGEPKECSDSNCRVAAENETSTYCEKVKSENTATEEETVGLKITDEELDNDKSSQSITKLQSAAEGLSNTESSEAAETGAETTQRLDNDVSASASVSDVFYPEPLQHANKLETVCSKTNVDSLIENDSCKADAEAASVTVGNVNNKQQTEGSNTDSIASGTVSETPCQPVSSEKNSSNIRASIDSERGDQEQRIESTTDLTAATQSKCCSPQRLKKLVIKQGKAAPSDSPVAGM